MQETWVVDGHCDSLVDYTDDRRKLRGETTEGHWDIGRAKAGRVGLQFLAAFIGSEYKPHRATWRGLQLIEAAHRFINENPQLVFLIRNNIDLDRIPDQQRIALLLSIEGGEILGESLFMLDIIYELGVRAIGLTWNQRNAIGDGAGESQSQSRLTKFGEKVIRRMNELGMVIDVSHLNEQGFWHALEISDRPIIASHSCCAALCPDPRNLTDQQLKLLAEHGGVVGINFLPRFLNGSTQASINDVVRHITHIAEVAGIDSVGLGSDFDGIEYVPTGLENAGNFLKLSAELIKAGFSMQDVHKVFHDNFMRFLRSVLK